MQEERINKITEALFSNSASVMKDGILKYASVEELFELSLHTQERVAFRAAWFLEHILLSSEAETILSNYDRIIKVYIESNNWSVLRSITKILMTYLHQTDISSLTENDVEKIINKTFNALENSDCPIAVRCNLYDILHLLIPQQRWLISELKYRIQLDLAINETPALSSRAKRILKKLERIT